ncbi:2-amino-4-hydroxy-6-hydroxymethyldihydropteridine diphosphokinase [Marinobacterium jannaschii]|uniref:2-amino-4-hydroxy-6- hydroxymethyldihydropteridine diphosphokinase n=1 Tax=Marinobacterium jannaschii TaxID=64970 RepID=UPI0004821B4B|nr:2-amino-4-hydroxy-6-hydroxymethyldihydropteridine diphosphokinase [Marinobacterium jannaschii]
MAQVYVSIGSNMDRERYISSCLDALQKEFGALQLSSVYESEAVGFAGDPFLNMVAGFQTLLPVGELSVRLKQIEDEHDRCRQGPKFSGRTLDIDILTYDDCQGNCDGIQLPRDEITRNAFVLWPLAEIAAETCHPLSQQSYAQLWSDYDKSKQKLWPVDFIWQDVQISCQAGTA